MRSNSPYPVRNSPYPSRSSPYPSRNSPYPSRSSPYPRAESRVIVGDLEDSLGGLAQQNSVDVDETQPLLGADKSATAVYTRRWYLLLLFSLVALIQTLIWATWGPISQSAEAAFSWDDSNIAMCVWMGNVPFALFCIPLAWLMDHKGLRVSVLLTCFFMASGAGLRCLIHFLPPSYTLWCVYGGQMLNGMAGPVAQGGAALFSNLWFPNNQRATSTAISTFTGYLGSALAFVIGPQFVPSPPDDSSSNGTLPDGNDTVWRGSLQLVSDDDNSTVTTDFAEQRSSIMAYLYYREYRARQVYDVLCT